MTDIWDIWNVADALQQTGKGDVNMIGKRPEQVLVKGETQSVICPACGEAITVDSRTRETNCNCGQSINWGLQK